MSYNMIDFTLFKKLEASAEAFYHKTFASYQKYKFHNIKITSSSANIVLKLNHTHKEMNNINYAEAVVSKEVVISLNQLYNNDLFELLLKSLDVALGAYYIVDIDNGDITLHAKEKGRIPSITTPSITIKSTKGIEIELAITNIGTDTSVYVPRKNENIVHLPITTFGKNYTIPKVGDRLIFIDSVENAIDKTFTREVIKVEKHAKCTCDVLTLDLPIDRLESNHNRINGLGIQRPSAQSNNYTASFDKVKVFRRIDDYFDILTSRSVPTNRCAKPIGNYANMKEVSKVIVNKFLENSSNPYSKHKMQYFGANFKWYDFREELQSIYDEFGQYLTEDLFLLKSNKHRPEYLLHIDYDHDSPEQPVVGSFTWPVLNCNSNTITVWYDAYKDGEKLYQYGKQDVVIVDDTIELKEIDRYIFDTEKFNAILLKHNDWHTLYNNDNSVEDRMLLQWRFKPNLTWEEILTVTQKLWNTPGT